VRSTALVEQWYLRRLATRGRRGRGAEYTEMTEMEFAEAKDLRRVHFAGDHPGAIVADCPYCYQERCAATDAADGQDSR
jgi:hypothetical protein